MGDGFEASSDERLPPTPGLEEDLSGNKEERRPWEETIKECRRGRCFTHPRPRFTFVSGK